MARPEPLVILGTGLAGYTTAREFRKLDADRPLVLVSADDGGFYSKPMLSNALAQGKSPDALLTADANRMAAQLNADIHPHTRVTAIDTTARAVYADALELQYGHLVLALGADPIRLPLLGDAAGRVVSVNDRADYARFRAAIEGRRRVLILGGGLIGCEFANDLAQAGYQVSVVDIGAHPLGRLVPPEVGAVIRDALSRAGVDWHLGVSATAVDGNEAGVSVALSDGTVLATDVVLSAIGLRPRTELAAAAGLAVARGVVTDRYLETSAAGLYALGDCAEVSGLVLSFVMPLMQGARALAATLHGKPTPVTYPAMPVVVKTPACPLVVAPPAAGAQGAWELDISANDARALYRGPGGELLGFALAGGATTEKQVLTRELPPVLA